MSFSIGNFVGRMIQDIGSFIEIYRDESQKAREEYLQIQCRAYHVECKSYRESDEYINDAASSLIDRLFSSEK